MNFTMKIPSDVWFLIAFTFLVIAVVLIVRAVISTDQRESKVNFIIGILVLLISLFLIDTTGNYCYDKETYVTVIIDGKTIVERKKPFSINKYGVKSNSIKIKFLDGSVIDTAKENVVIESQE